MFRNRVSRLFAFGLLFVSLPLAVADTAGKPVALLGTPASTTAVIQQVLLPENVLYERHDQWLAPGDYRKYSVVYFAENVKGVEGVTEHMWGGSVATVEEYVRSGGVIIATGATPYHLGAARDLSGIASLLGFAKYGGSSSNYHPACYRATNARSTVTEHLGEDRYDWSGWPLSIGDVTSAEPLAEALDDAGEVMGPFVTVNTLGEGKVFWFSAPLFRMQYRQEPTAEADETGRWTMTERGEEVEAYRQMLVRAIREGKPATGRLTFEKWDPTPLGEPVQPVQAVPVPSATSTTGRPAEVAGDPVLLTEDGQSRSCLVTSDQPSENETHVTQVIRDHLRTMSGADVATVTVSVLGEVEASLEGIRTTDPKWQGFSFVLIGACPLASSLGVSTDGLGPEGILLKTVGSAIVIAGADDAGLRHAMYTFLEAIGCRYLWPGDLGKVVPLAPTVRVPPLDIRESPRLWSRYIRSGLPYRSSRMAPGFEKLSIDPEEYRERFEQASSTQQQDDGWFAWHRMGSHRTVARGHSFGDYWTRFGQDHPDWFALQPNGVRDQSLSAARPRLCHTNRELIQQIISDRLEALRKDPSAPGVPIGLNDGGYTTFCMCERCRKLDPANGREVSLLNCVAVPRHNYAYVSLTDRVLWFTNQIAEAVAKEFPDKHLGFYAYSAYNAPPLREKPHPNLIIFYVGESLEDWDGWTRYGNKVFYRPNVLLRSRRRTAPQNFSHELFDKFRHMYSTGLIGTDFDSCQHQWALKGLIYYVLAKAHWDPTQIDYDALVEDYCRAGFANAGEPVQRYFSILEQISTKAAEQKADLIEVYAEGYLPKLQACLDEARAAAAGNQDPSVPKRVEFLQLGLDLAKNQVDLYRSPDDDDVKQRFREFLVGAYETNPVAINVPLVATYGRF